MTLTLTIDAPADLARFRLPAAVACRLQALLDRQDAGQLLSSDERAEAEGLTDLADLLTLLRLRAERGMDLDLAYQQMARDEAREVEALQRAEATVGDVADETR